MSSRMMAAAAFGCAVFATTALHAAPPMLPNGSANVDAMAMTGPYDSLAAICTADGTDPKQCSDPAAAKVCGFTGGKLTGAFSESRVLDGCAIALHAPAGWYVLSVGGLPAWANFLNNGDRYVSTVDAIAAGGSAAPKSVLVRGTFVHDTDAAKMPWLYDPPAGDWYECEQRLFVCAIGDAGPSCAGPFSVSYTARCRSGEQPDKLLGRVDPHDYRFGVSLAGTTLTFRPPSYRPAQPRTAPLPGWAVTALDAPGTKDQTRQLSPEHVELRFP